jgi:hypothetical protein
MAAPKAVVDLVDRFDFNKNDYKDPSYKESNLRSEFLDPFLQELGWDVTNSQGFSEKFKEVRVEPSVEVGGSKKAPDYEFRIGGERIFFAEAKKPSVDLLNDKSAALQIRRYGWSAKLPVCILTDFEELSFYDTSFAPKPSDGARIGRIRYFSYEDYKDSWDDIYGLISREAVLKGYFEKFSKDKSKKYDKSELDVDFLKWLEGTRLKIASHIFENNKSLELLDVQHVTQLLIDRLLFCRICEDRKILGDDQLLKISKVKAPYKGFLKYCEDLQVKFNSSLFSLRPEKNSPHMIKFHHLYVLPMVFLKTYWLNFIIRTRLMYSQ